MYGSRATSEIKPIFGKFFFISLIVLQIRFFLFNASFPSNVFIFLSIYGKRAIAGILYSLTSSIFFNNLSMMYIFIEGKELMFYLIFLHTVTNNGNIRSSVTKLVSETKLLDHGNCLFLLNLVRGNFPKANLLFIIPNLIPKNFFYT